nr:sialyltransferase-like protein 1 [Ipomoea batatas]
MQYRNMATVLTREYLDARPDGWSKILVVAARNGYQRSVVKAQESTGDSVVNDTHPRSNMWLLLLKTPHSSAAATAFPLQNPQGNCPTFLQFPLVFTLLDCQIAYVQKL